MNFVDYLRINDIFLLDSYVPLLFAFVFVRLWTVGLVGLYRFSVATTVDEVSALVDAVVK